MKKIIRLTESDLHNIIKETVKRVLKEDGGMVGGAAANGSGFMNGANNSQTSSNAQFDVPFGGVQRRKGYSPKGDGTSKMTEVDMTPAMKRHDGKGGSISIPKRNA
jgi:hypothetical protein